MKALRTNMPMFSFRSFGSITLQSKLLSPHDLTKNARPSALMITRAYQNTPKKVVAPVVEILANNKIKFPILRVVYKDRDTGENTHKVMSRNDALDLAREYATDLLLGDCIFPQSFVHATPLQATTYLSDLSHKNTQVSFLFLSI